MVNLNNQDIGIDYRLYLVTSATKKTELNFSLVLPWTRVSRTTKRSSAGLTFKPKFKS